MAFEIENGVLKRVYDVEDEKIIYVPDTVKTIATYAFSNLTITEVFIPDSVTSIQNSAFHNCYIEKISVPKNLNTTGIFGNSIFFGIGDIIYNPTENKTKTKIKTKTETKIERRKTTTKTTAVEEKVYDASAEPSETDYKQLFLDLVYIKELPEKDKVLDNIYDDDVKIPLAVYFFISYKSEKAKKYISDNFQKVMHYLVDQKDMNGINAVMSIENKEKTI